MPCFLSLSLSFRLIPWSAEALWVHFPARVSKTLSRRCSVPSPHREGAWGLREQSKPCARGFIGFLRKPRNISLFSLLYFLNCKILSLSLSLFLLIANAILPRESLDPTKAGPQQCKTKVIYLGASQNSHVTVRLYVLQCQLGKDMTIKGLDHSG